MGHVPVSPSKQRKLAAARARRCAEMRVERRRREVVVVMGLVRTRAHHTRRRDPIDDDIVVDVVERTGTRVPTPLQRFESAEKALAWIETEYGGPHRRFIERAGRVMDRVPKFPREWHIEPGSHMGLPLWIEHVNASAVRAHKRSTS